MKTIKDFVLQSWLNFCWFMFICAKRHSSIELWWNDGCVRMQLRGYQPSKWADKFSFNFAKSILRRK